MNTRTDKDDDSSSARAEGLVAQQATELVWLVPQVARQLGMTLLDPMRPALPAR